MSDLDRAYAPPVAAIRTADPAELRDAAYLTLYVLLVTGNLLIGMANTLFFLKS